MYCSINPSDRPIQPSIIYYCEGLFRAIASHPLINTDRIIHPITKEKINISSYRFIDGVEVGEGLICSIFPAYESFQESPPSPMSNQTSVIHKEYSLGGKQKEDVYNFIIKLTYKEVNVDLLDFVNDKKLVEVPFRNEREQVLLHNTKVVELYHNPPLSIISEYLGILKIILDSHYWLNQFFDYSDLYVFHTNYNSIEWSSNANAYFNNGHLFLGIKAYCNTGWEDKYYLPIENINVDVNKGNN